MKPTSVALLALVVGVAVAAPVASAAGASPVQAAGSSPAVQADDPRPPDEQWNHTYDSPSDEIFSSIIETPEGYLLVGWTDHDGSDDGWVLAVDDQGRERWSAVVGGDGIDRLYGAVRTADGGYLLAGRTDEDDEARGWLLKVKDGDVRWERTVASRPGGFRTVARNESAILAGGWTWDDGTAGWLVTVDEEGEVQRERTYHSGEDARTYVKTLAVDGDGVLLAGESETEDGQDGWAARVAADGTAEWNRTYGNASYDDLWEVATTDAGYALAGETGTEERESRDAWALALDRDGDVRWQRTYGEEGYDWLDSAAATDDGLLFTGGTSTGGIGGVDGFVVMTDGDGTERWRTAVGTAQWDKPWPAVATDDSYVLAGQSSGFGTNGTAGWLVRLAHVDGSTAATATEQNATASPTDRAATGNASAPESLWRPELTAFVLVAAIALGALVARR